MNALEIAIKGLVDEKHVIITIHLTCETYYSGGEEIVAYEKRLTVIDSEIERLLTLQYQSRIKEIEAREKFLNKITT